jgi:hypothetical protein
MILREEFTMSREIQREDQIDREELDKEWVYLTLLARESGMKIEEVRSFLDQFPTRIQRTNTK